MEMHVSMWETRLARDRLALELGGICQTGVLRTREEA